MPRPFRLPEKWPLPDDEGAAERLIARFSALGREDAERTVQHPATHLLRALGGNSPYLADLAVREHASLRLLIERGPGIVIAEALARLHRTPPSLPRQRIAATLREAKRQVALATAIADIGGLWRLERVSAALSDLAEAALVLAIRHLLLSAHAAGRVRLPDPSEPDRASGFAVLGMGKLGARELNYSSDVDLVLLYDPAAAAVAEMAGVVYARLARDLVSLMEEHDADGYVFRVDLRLRPDPAATAPAVALPAALSYYESMAQNWERAAMVKARPVAGDRALGDGFLAAIRPFVWRRYLDFAAIADIHAMRRRIDTRIGASRLPAHGSAHGPFAPLAGYNLKLGAGGIRAIEFITQTLQLVWGGRDPALRTAATLPALAALTERGVLAPRAARELAAAYRALRTVEHRLQMVADRQTHSFPPTAEGVAHFMLFLGRAGGPGRGRLATRLLRHLKRVETHYHEMLEPPGGEADALLPALDVRGIEKPGQAAREALAGLGFANLDGALAVLAAWQAGRYRALRTERARELLLQLLPRILGALARQRDPDAALARFDTFLAHLSAGVQTLSLFQHHPAMLGRIAAVLGAAPSLAEHLARNPPHLDGLLAPEVADQAPERTLAARLTGIRNFEETIEEMRAFVQAEAFRISVATLERRLDADEAGIVRTRLAEAALRLLLPRVLADFARRFGSLPSGRMAVVALGKAGGREMMAGSDLDLMLIYDHSPEVAESRGSRPMAASEWFIRAAHAFIAALSAPGAEGPVYAVDMRLRPSGNKGPVAVSLAAFERYHAVSAWTWERMALTRARVVAGPAGFRGEIEAAIRRALEAGGTPGRIRADAVAMRARIARELRPSGPWDVRHRRGGSLEVDFIAQALQLIHGPTHPALWSPSTRQALVRLASAGLLASEDANVLHRADHAFRTIQGMLRVALGGPAMKALPESVAAVLLKAVRAGGEDVAGAEALEAYLERMTGSVHALFERTLGMVQEKAQ